MRDYSTIVEELHEAQVELEQLEGIERHNAEVERGVETLKEVQRTLEEISKDAEGTSKKIEEYREELDGVIEKLKQANEEFGTALQEELKPLSEAGGEVAEGVSQFGEAAGEVGSTLKEMADRLDQVKELIDLGEAPASEILDGFDKYFGELVDLLGPLADRLPGLGAFITIWLEAIRRIRGSIERIEAITATRRAQIEDIVGEDIYVGGEGPVAVRRGRIGELRDRVDSLREEAAAHPDAPVPPPSGQTIVLQHESDFALGTKAVAGDGSSLGQLQEDAFWSNVALDEAKKDLAAWERNQPGQQPGTGQSAAELEVELERQRQALEAATDQPTRLQIADRIGQLESAITTARANEMSAARGAELRQRVETAQWFAAKAQARLTALLNAIRDWLVNDLRARGPGSGRPQWNADDHERFNTDHPEIRITPEDVRAPVGALAPSRAQSVGGSIGSAVPIPDRGRATRYRAAGAAMALVGAFLLFQSFQVTANQPPGASTSGPASASASAAPPVAQPPEPSASEPPVTALLTGSSQGVANFVRESGTCFPEEFGAGYLFEADQGALTATQPGAVPHVSTGTIDPSGAFDLVGESQTYTGRIDGTLFEGVYTDTTDGCNEVYQFSGQLLRPFLEGPPFGTAPGYFEFLGLSSGQVSLDLTDVASEPSVEVIVASQTLDMTTQLPIRVIGSSGDDTLFDITIQGNATSVCRGPTGCSAPIPGNATLADPNLPITVIATGSGNDVIAVSMPHGAPVDTSPTEAPTAAPTPAPTASPTTTPTATPAPQPTASPAPSTAQPGTDAPNLPLAALGLALVAGGLGVGLAGPRVIGGASSTRPGTAVTTTPIEAVAASVIAADVAATPLIGRAWKETAHETSGSRTALIAGAAALLVLAAGIATALATGLIGGSGTAADPSQSQVAGASDPAAPSEAPSEEPTTPVASVPVAGPPFPELAGLGLQPPDPTADAIEPVGLYSIDGVDGEYFPDSVNAVEYGAWVANLDQATVDTLFNATTFDCTNVVDGVLTACDSNNPIDPGPMFIAAVRLAEPIPQESSDGMLIYSLVLDADGDPANNFVAEEPFNNDFFQGTDRWYELVYTPELGWYLTVDRNETLSDARAAIMGDLVVFFVPMAELAVDAPGYRLTTFVSSDASFEPATSGGDMAPGPPDAAFELAEPTVGGGGATGFLVRLGKALAEGDTRFLLDRLHSAVIDRYGASACLLYVDAVVDPSNAVDPVRAGAPEEWEYETDGLSTTIDEAYPVAGFGDAQRPGDRGDRIPRGDGGRNVPLVHRLRYAGGLSRGQGGGAHANTEAPRRSGGRAGDRAPGGRAGRGVRRQRRVQRDADVHGRQRRGDRHRVGPGRRRNRGRPVPHRLGGHRVVAERLGVHGLQEPPMGDVGVQCPDPRARGRSERWRGNHRERDGGGRGECPIPHHRPVLRLRGDQR